MPIYPPKKDPPVKKQATHPALLKAIESEEKRKKQGPFLNPRASIPYDPVDSRFADIARSLIPAPKNVSQAIVKTVFDDARMSNSSLSDREKLVLWETIQNAKTRTGKNKGGTQYSDYGNQGWGSPEEFNKRFNKGENNIVETVGNSLTNPGFKMASTVGRGMYQVDESDPNTVHYTDNYDWNKNEKDFAGKNVYQKIRNFVRQNEDTTVKKENFDMKFTLSKHEIDKIKSKQDYMNNGPQFGKYAGMLYPKSK